MGWACSRHKQRDRESDDPGTLLTTAPTQLAALLHHLKRAPAPTTA
ncbi:hypothetical protein ABZX30_02590 [Streptomyces sp. NPDC004542]